MRNFTQEAKKYEKNDRINRSMIFSGGHYKFAFCQNSVTRCGVIVIVAKVNNENQTILINGYKRQPGSLEFLSFDFQHETFV